MRFTVKDVMTAHVIAVRKGASFKEIAEGLREYWVSAFPVVDDDGKVIGVVSEADLLTKKVLDGGQEGVAGVTAGDLMTHPAVTVGLDEPVEHAAALMYARRVKRLPVTDAADRLAGIISRSDVLTVYSRPDEEIRKEITDKVILNEFPTDPARFTVTVQDGIVTLEGHPETARLGQHIVSQARHVQGVIVVRDRLSYPSFERPVNPVRSAEPSAEGPGRRRP